MGSEARTAGASAMLLTTVHCIFDEKQAFQLVAALLFLGPAGKEDPESFCPGFQAILHWPCNYFLLMYSHHLLDLAHASHWA